MAKKCVPLFWLVLIQIILGYEWLYAALMKLLSQGKFIKDLPQTLNFFASNNPYGWYKSFLTGIAASNAAVFGYVCMLGELFSGLALIVFGLVLIFYSQRNWMKAGLGISATACATGIIMNVAYYLAAAWTSPAVGAINELMLLTQVVLFAALLRAYKRLKNDELVK